MRNHSISKPVRRADNDFSDQWFKGYDDEQFISFTNEGWYVESREGEFGPFENLKEAEDFYYERFRSHPVQGKSKPLTGSQTGFVNPVSDGSHPPVGNEGLFLPSPDAKTSEVEIVFSPVGHVFVGRYGIEC